MHFTLKRLRKEISVHMCGKREKIQMIEGVSKMLTMERSGWRVCGILHIVLILASF